MTNDFIDCGNIIYCLALEHSGLGKTNYGKLSFLKMVSREGINQYVES